MKVYRIIRWVVLGVSLISIGLLFRRPAPVAAPQTAAVREAAAESFQDKLTQLERTGKTQPEGVEIRLTADEVSAAMSQSPAEAPAPVATRANTGSTAPAADAASADQPTIREQQIAFDGDTVRGQFLTEVAGKDVYVTIAGHLGSRDGYVTFDPTDFKVGDLSVPVSLVNSALQKKLAEEHDRLKLPEFIDEVRVENSELVVRRR